MHNVVMLLIASSIDLKAWRKARAVHVYAYGYIYIYNEQHAPIIILYRLIKTDQFLMYHYSSTSDCVLARVHVYQFTL